MPRPASSPLGPSKAVAFAAALLLGSAICGQITPSNVRQGLAISEVHHQSAPHGGGTQPTYIEIINLDPLNGINLGSATILAGRPGVAPSQFPLPPVSLSPYSKSTSTGALVVFDPTTGIAPAVTPGNLALPVSNLLADPLLLAPNQPTFVCITWTSAAGIPRSDAIALNWPPGVPIPCGTFVGSINHATGLALRHYRVDSNTFMDFLPLPFPVPPPDPPYAGPPPGPSPGRINPEMSRVTAFFLGSPQSAAGAPGIVFPTPPISSVGGAGVVSGLNSPPVSVPVSIVQQGGVGFLEFAEHPYNLMRRVNNPIFDPVLSTGIVTMTTVLSGEGAFLARDPSIPTGVSPVAPGMLWSLVVPDPIGTNNGVLDINMGPLEQVGIGFQIYNPTPGATPSGARLRIARYLSDLTTDGTASGSGGLSSVQLDVLPPEEPPGDVWCELIVYDMNGFSYRAKARNWPPDPNQCAGPFLALGSNAPGNLDVIALCFDPASPKELFILPSANTASPTGSGPLFGLIPDPLTFAFLSLPLGVHPAHVKANADGTYFWSFTAPSLTGLSLDATAVEYDPTPGQGFGPWSLSQTATVTVL